MMIVTDAGGCDDNVIDVVVMMNKSNLLFFLKSGRIARSPCEGNLVCFITFVEADDFDAQIFILIF